MCNFCEIDNKIKESLNLFSDSEMNAILFNIKNKIVNLNSFSEGLYIKTAIALTDKLYIGYGHDIEYYKENSEDYNMLFSLRENIYVFSAAKQYQFLREVLSLNDVDFEIQSKEIFLKYYDEYLKVEMDASEQVGISVSDWQAIIKWNNE